MERESLLADSLDHLNCVYGGISSQEEKQMVNA